MSTIAALNAFQLMHIRTIRPILRSEVPTARRREKDSGLRGLEVVKDFNILLGNIRDKIVSPFEVIGEIDTTGSDCKAEKARRKTFAGSFRSLLKACVKEHGLSNQVDVVEREHGMKFFVVGREA